MKVLHVINSLAMGGAERLVADLLPLLVQRGINCSVFALDESKDAFSCGLLAAGVPMHFARNGKANPYSPLRMCDVARIIRKEEPEIVHAHLGPSFHWCALASLASPGLKLVATEHAIANRRMRMPLIQGFERWCYGRYERIACVSEETAEAIRGWLGLPATFLPVIPNGVAIGRFEGAIPDAEIVSWAAGRTLVVMTARFVPAKDHRTAVNAIARLSEHYAMLFVGDGPTRVEVEEAARLAGIKERCFFLGSRKDIPSILACADIYLQSSREEGFGIACLEAMAAGLPVVASDVGGLGSLVRGAGTLFPAGDAAACADAIRKFSENREEREASIAAGRKRVGEHSMERVADRYAALYAEVRGMTR